MKKIISSKIGFGDAFEMIKNNASTLGMRLPDWDEDNIVRVQVPDEHSKMTRPYLYLETTFERLPWKESNFELFAPNWDVVNVRDIACEDTTLKMWKATPEFDIDSDKWIININVDGDIMPVGKMSDDDMETFEYLRLDSEREAVDWILSKPHLYISEEV